MVYRLYQEWLVPEKLLLLQGWKRNGLTDEEIAKNIGVSGRTLAKWKVQHSQIKQALKISKQQANFLIENKLFEKARKGNTTAMIFYLKNNWREKYNDSQLSVEERQLAQQRARKIKAETLIAEYQAKLLVNPDSITDKTIILDDIPEQNGGGTDEDH